MRRKLMSANRGSVLVIALFVIIVFGALSFALNKLRVDESNTFVYSSIQEQARLASFSALETASLQLYPLGHHGENGIYDVNEKVGRCSLVSDLIRFDSSLFTVISRCEVKLSCERRGAKVDDPAQSFGVYTQQINYFLKAQALCTYGTQDTDNYVRVSHSEYRSLIDGSGL